MEEDYSINKTEPSDIVAKQIVEKSEYCNDIMDTLISLREEIEHTRDEDSLLELNGKLQLQMQRLSRLKEYAEDIHEIFRTVPLHFRSKRLQQAEAYFYQGKFQEMDEALDASKIREEIERLDEDRFQGDEERKKKAIDRLECRSYELIVKALYHYTLIENPEWYESVYELLMDAHDASYSVPAMYELASYLRSTDEKDWALELLNDAYVISRETEGETARLYEAKCLWAMGIISGNKEDFPEAIKYLGKAVKIYTDLSETNPGEYRSKTANMLCVLGDYHIHSRNFSVALVVFEEAMNIRRELALHGDWERHMDLADVLDKLATVHACREEFGEAISRYEESLRIRDDHIDENLYLILGAKANTLYNMAVVHFTAKEYEKAASRAKDELQARKRLQDIDPFGQLPFMARTEVMLGDIYLHLNSPTDAIREREKAVKWYKILAKRYPDEYLLKLGEAMNHCSNLYFRMKAYGKYFLSMQEAIGIFRQLAATDPEEYLLTVGCLLGNVCHYYEQIAPDRKKMVENAREVCKILSSIERNEIAEKVYSKAKQIVENH